MGRRRCEGVARLNSSEGIRLVQGSHIVTRSLFDHGKCYFFQGEDGRIIFAIPYETDFTLIGTTDQEYNGNPSDAACTDEERDYLLAFANQYFREDLTADDVVWTYSGVRPLYDDGAKSATAATRDYVLSMDENGPPILSVFGGKITTYRRLAEGAMRKTGTAFPDAADEWTAGVALPGGNFAVDGFEGLVAKLEADFPFLNARWARRLVRAYGTEARDILGKCSFGRGPRPRLRSNADRSRVTMADGERICATRRGCCLAAIEAWVAVDFGSDRSAG